VVGIRASYGDDEHCTTLHHKTHNTSLKLARGDAARVAYAWHPWFGRLVVVHDLKTRSSGVFARCRPDGAASGALQEIPAWMLDVAVCSTMRAMAVPVVSLPALKDLAILLAETRNGKAAPLQGDARVTSRDHHQGDRHAAPPVFAPSAEATARPLRRKPTTDTGVERSAGSGAADAGQPDDPPAPRSRREGRNQVAERPR
jgi:hypothetical protein